MTTLICPITRLPIEYQEPVVGMLLTAESARVTAQGPFDPHSVWAPRVMPVRGLYDENLAVAWERSEILGLWERGLRTDVVPRRGRGGDPRRGRGSDLEVIGKRATLDEFFSQISVGRLFARDHQHTWASKLDPAIPTRGRVERALSVAQGETRGAVVRVGPSSVFPVVEVHVHLQVEETNDTSCVRQAQERVVDIALKHGWGARAVESASEIARGFGRVEIVPHNLADAIEREHDRRRLRGPRRVVPVGLAVYSARGWQALLDLPADGFVGGRRVLYSAHYFRSILGRVADAWGRYPATPCETMELEALDKHMRLLWALGDATEGMIPAPVHDTVFHASWRLGMCWHLATMLDAGWCAADRDAALDRAAEVIAVHEVMGALGLTWGPAASARSGRPWEAWAGLARVTEREAERRQRVEMDAEETEEEG